MKKLLIIVLALFAVSCSTDQVANNTDQNQEQVNVVETTNQTSKEEATTDENEETTADELPVFNAESLSQYNGEDGMKAYVAVDGIVYDVTDVAAWQSPHAGQFKPGKDYSEEIKSSPHGKKNLEGLEVVGTYEE
jgi:predicted heme/steroid binding protein